MILNDEIKELNEEIEKKEKEIKELKARKRKLETVDDIKEMFYEKYKEFVDLLYDEYRLVSIYELIALPYDQTNHMRRWKIYDKYGGFSIEVKRRRDDLWKDMYRKTVEKVTGGRVWGITNKYGDLQISDVEMKKLRKELIAKIDKLFE